MLHAHVFTRTRNEWASLTDRSKLVSSRLFLHNISLLVSVIGCILSQTMAGKSKFQVSKLLDDRIKSISDGSLNECDTDYSQVDCAYVLGFHVANVTNYVGLSKDYTIYSAGHQVTGLVFFKNMLNETDIASQLTPIRDYYQREFGAWKADKNEHLYLVYTIDKESKQPVKRIFDLVSSQFLAEQPKLSVLDGSKIYNHSAITKVQLRIDTQLKKDDKVENILEELDRLKESFTPANARKCLTVQLHGSNYSSKTPLDDKNPVESLYDTLDVPADLEQMGDYLPQMTKEEKKKVASKWRNKVKAERDPLSLELVHETLSSDDSESSSNQLDLDTIMYLHVNDTIAKAISIVLFLVRQRLEQLKTVLKSHSSTAIEPKDVKFCSFKPAALDHFVQLVYLLPDEPNYNSLAEIRQQVHENYLAPKDRPLFRFSQRVTNIRLLSSDEESDYLCNVHAGLADKSPTKGGTKSVVQGKYTYHHYLQDKISDNGWGCAYRSLQTIISWLKHQGYIYSPDVAVRAPKLAQGEDKTGELRLRLHREARVPNHKEIQSVLVDVGDKQASFIGSEKWIGSQEVCYVLNHLYDIESKFISVSSGSELVYKARDLGQHFSTQFTPVMIGGGVLAHTIIGLDFNDKNGDISYLILDPHYTGSEDLSTITKKGWCGWKKNAFWDSNAFYNLCLPQRPLEI